jgi:autotransporter-associated beta strand protein
MNLFVGNNNTANGGTSASTQSGSTIPVGNFNINQASGQTIGGGLAVTGANGYKLQIANVNITLQATYAANWNATLNTTTAPLIVAGNVQQAAGSGGTTTLQLDGTATNNLIAGNIMDSADGSPRVLSVTKLGTGTWTLSGKNTYTGTTTVSGGTLVLAASTCLPDAGTLSIASSKVVQINTGVREKVGSLVLGGVTQTALGTYGSTSSTATYKSAYFTGTGLIYMGIDPPSKGTVITFR